MAFERMYLVTTLAYAVVGMLLGIVMAATHNHVQHVTHAHMLLVGAVIPFMYAVVHRLWLRNVRGAAAIVQFFLHQVGAFVLVVSLYLLYGNIAALETLEPVLAVSSISVLLGVIFMLLVFLKFGTDRTLQEPVSRTAEQEVRT